MKVRSAKFLLKLFIFAIVLSTIPVIFIGIFSYFKAAGIIQDKVQEGNMQILYQTQMRIEQSLKTLDYSVTQFITSPLISNAMKQSITASEHQLLNDILSGLYSLHTTDLDIQELCLVNINEDWLINNNGIYRLSESPEKEKLMKLAAMPRVSQWMRVERQSTGSEESTENGTSVYNGVSFIKKVPIFSLKPKGLIITTIPSFQISNLMTRDKKMGDFLILDQEYRVVANQNDELVGADFSRLEYTRKLQQAAETFGYFTAVQDGMQTGVTFRRSDYNGWIYLSVVSLGDITRDSREIGLITLLTCFAVLVLTGLASFLGSKRMYSPIRRLYENMTKGLDERETGRRNNEFECIEDRVNTILKDQTRMALQIKGQQQRLREYFILKLLQGEAKQEEVKEQVELMGEPSRWKWFCILSVKIDTLEDTPYEEKDRDLMMFAINNIVGELLPVENRMDPIVIKQSQVTVVGGLFETREKFRNFVFPLAESIQKVVHQSLKLKVSVGISRIYGNFSEVFKAFNESAEALKYRVHLGHEAVLYIDDVQPGHRLQLTYPKQLKNQLVDAIKLQDADRADELLHQFIGEIFSEGLNHHDYQVYLIRFMMELAGIIQDLGESYESIFADEKVLLEQLSELKTVRDIKNWFKHTMIEPVLNYLETRNSSHQKTISGEILRLIHEEYDSDLTLEACAARLSYHPNYIRRVFRKETGVNFGDYLSQYRMKMAKKWLVETDLKISEIAEKIGYNNVQNFIRYFRKVESMTPGQYREANSAK